MAGIASCLCFGSPQDKEYFGHLKEDFNSQQCLCVRAAPESLPKQRLNVPELQQSARLAKLLRQQIRHKPV